MYLKREQKFGKIRRREERKKIFFGQSKTPGRRSKISLELVYSPRRLQDTQNGTKFRHSETDFSKTAGRHPQVN